MPIPLDRLYLTFNSFEEAQSFGIEYTINAGNLPREAKGYLSVIVRREGQPE
jgi:hypothetical protein